MSNTVLKYVKPKGKIWNFLPYSAKTGVTIYPYIYLPKAFFDNLNSTKPNEYYLALVEHEKVHLQKQKEMGLILFCFKYFFFPQFRLQEELAAYKVQKVYLEKRKLIFNTDTVAKNLSGFMYLYCTSYTKAKEML